MLKPPSSGPTRLASLLIVSTLILSGCGTTTGSDEIKGPPPPAAPVNAFCEIAKTISWSTKDTDQTIREVKAHNAVYLALCGK